MFLIVQKAYLSISELHTSGKFQVGDIGRVEHNGVEVLQPNALSSIYALLVQGYRTKLIKVLFLKLKKKAGMKLAKTKE